MPGRTTSQMLGGEVAKADSQSVCLDNTMDTGGPQKTQRSGKEGLKGSQRFEDTEIILAGDVLPLS